MSNLNCDTILDFPTFEKEYGKVLTNYKVTNQWHINDLH